MPEEKNRIVFFDLDGVIFRGQSQRLLLDLAVREGMIRRFHYYLLFIWFLAYRFGLVRRTSLIRRRACRLFRGVEVKKLEELLERHHDRFVNMIMPEARTLIRKHYQQGDLVVLISAAIEPLVGFFSILTGINRYIATQLVVTDGVYTGEMYGLAVYGNHKRDTALRFLQDSEMPHSYTICYSDHVSDLPLMEEVDDAVAVNPDRQLRRIARQRNWKILIFKK